MQVSHIRVVCCLVVALAAQSCLAKDAPLPSLSLEHFRDTATVTDDPIDGVTTVATEKGYVEHHGLLGAVWNDEYLTGTIDRKTGQRSFAVIATLTYRGARRTYRSAQFQSVKGQLVAPVVLLATNSVNCPTGECTYTDRVSFPVGEDLLRALVAGSVPDKPDMWRYTLAANLGGDYAGQFSSAEIAGFLAKVDEYTGLAPPPALRPVAVAKPELGIGGLHVDASEQLPARSGVLVTALTRGSLADKAGLIVGDIVREINGHSIETPSDMRTAIADAAPNAAITIKFYRGTTEMAFSIQQ